MVPAIFYKLFAGRACGWIGCGWIGLGCGRRLGKFTGEDGAFEGFSVGVVDEFLWATGGVLRDGLVTAADAGIHRFRTGWGSFRTE